ncbi:MAG TPA: YihY/virulence factor BrkB family protein [Microbacteriaceae bacterium]
MSAAPEPKAASAVGTAPERNTLPRLVARVGSWKPVRVFVRYRERRGSILARGLSYQSIFAVFAGLWLGFSVAGLVLRANPELSSAFFATINASVPGLIDVGEGTGAVKADQLLETSILGWSGVVAAVVLLFTGLGWLAAARDAVRALFDLPGERTNFLLLKLKDFGLAVGFGAALLVSAGLSLESTQALGIVLGWIGVDEHSLVAALVGRLIGLALMLLLDTAVLSALFRLLSGLTIPLRRLFAGALLGALALGTLKVLGSALLGGASRNPLLASFAVIIGLLIWFNLVCQVILLTASWIATGMADDGLIADPAIAAERREAERKEAERMEAERMAAEEARAERGFFSRLFRRRRRQVSDR